MHSKTSLNYLGQIMAENQLIKFDEMEWNQPIVSIEKKAPFFEFSYPDGKKGAVFACRHFMYYGESGRSFGEFREKMIRYIKREFV